LIAQSQSGTGKTAAFVLASLCRVDCNENTPQVIILSPTYELALQTGEVAQQMAKYKPQIKFRFAVRGENIPRGQQLTEHVIIGTPGRLWDLALKYKVFGLEQIKVFVLDDADSGFYTQGYRQQSIRIQEALPPDCQMMLFSVTYDSKVMEFAEKIIRDPNIIKLKREEESLDNINQFYVVCRNEGEKYKPLANIFGTIPMGQALIFCHTKASAASLANMLRKV
jgi:ATP-dependent RNA helicase DDX19/DBP5